MRGRVTAGTLKYLGLERFIAKNENDYLGIALKLLRDTDFNQAFRQDLLNNVDKLYENQSGIKELEEVFISILNGRVKTST